MKSIKCQSCGLVNFAEAEKCKRCQQPLAAAPLAAGSTTSLDSKEQSPPDHIAEGPVNERSSTSKLLMRAIPITVFGVPLILALKDRMFGPKAKPGGYTDTFELSVIGVFHRSACNGDCYLLNEEKVSAMIECQKPDRKGGQDEQQITAEIRYTNLPP